MPGEASGSGKADSSENQSRHTGREEKLGSHRGTRSSTRLGTHGRCQKQRSAPRGTCQQPGGSQSSARNRWQDAPEHAQGHKSSGSGAAKQPAAPRGQEGTSPGGKVISSLALLSGNSGWPAFRRIPGLSSPPDPRRGSEFLRFRWAGREASTGKTSHSAAAAPLPAGGPGARSSGGPGRLLALRTKRSEQRERSGTVSTTAGPALGAGQGAGRLPRAPGFRPGSLCAPKHSESLLGAKPRLESLQGYRGSCVQSRFVYRRASPVLAAEIHGRASVSPHAHTEPINDPFRAALPLYRSQLPLERPS